MLKTSLVAGQQKIEDGKDGLLDLAGVSGAGDYDQPVAEGDDDGGGAPGAAFGSD